MTDCTYETKMRAITRSHSLPGLTVLMLTIAPLMGISAQLLPPAVRTGLSVPCLGPPLILQVLHLHPAPPMLGAPAELFPHDAHRLGPPRTHVPRVRWPLRPPPGDPIANTRHQSRARARHRLRPPRSVLRPCPLRHVKDGKRR